MRRDREFSHYWDSITNGTVKTPVSYSESCLQNQSINVNGNFILSLSDVQSVWNVMIVQSFMKENDFPLHYPKFYIHSSPGVHGLLWSSTSQKIQIWRNLGERIWYLSHSTPKTAIKYALTKPRDRKGVDTSHWIKATMKGNQVEQQLK